MTEHFPRVAKYYGGGECKLSPPRAKITSFLGQNQAIPPYSQFRVVKKKFETNRFAAKPNLNLTHPKNLTFLFMSYKAVEEPILKI